MNDTRILPETATVAAYVARVRAALADLPAEEADELTQGMEADLTEAMSEGAGDFASRFGTPEAYAAELRSAAGLPPAPAAGPAQTTGWARLVAARDAWVERHPTLAKRGHELAPAWWLARGIGAGYVLGEVFYISRMLATLVLVAASLYLGVRVREDSNRPAWPRVIHRLWNLGGLVLVPIAAVLVLGLGVSSFGGTSATSGSDVWPQLTLHGANVEGVYAYGADGKRLDNVRLFTTDGTPITVQAYTNPTLWVDTAGRQWTNVFPGATQYGLGWTMSSTIGSPWTPPTAIDPLLRQVPTPEGQEGSGLVSEAPPTEALATQSATPTGSATSPTSPTVTKPPAPTATTSSSATATK